MSAINLELPYPISTNRYWRTFRGRPVVSAEAKAYKRETAARIREAGHRAPFEGSVAVCLAIAPKARLRPSKRPERCIDIDNALKVALDALQGLAFENDAQVARLSIERITAVPNGALFVRVEELSQ